VIFCRGGQPQGIAPTEVVALNEGGIDPTNLTGLRDSYSVNTGNVAKGA